MQSPAPSNFSAVGNCDDVGDQPARGERGKTRGEYRLFVLPLAMAKARQHGPAAEHDRGIGGEDEVGQAGLRRQNLDRGAG